MCGLAGQLPCPGQNATWNDDKKPATRAAGTMAPGQTNLVNFAALEPPAAGLGIPLIEAAGVATDSTAAASGGSGTASPSTSTDTAAAPVAVPVKSDAVIKELSEMKKQFSQLTEMEAEMKARIGKLETELDTDKQTDDAEKDASELRSAEVGDSSGMAPGTQAPTTPPPAAAPAPEIDAQITTKGEPFPGDWTWLNSNGHAVDSPMSTKYFTPEFRADANYTLDYNHPEDDTLGGSTETFRSDEWQLEQISAGGDIRIQNVRGRILTMDGLFATTTPRNDGSVGRGSWDLAGAYKYVSEAWGGYHWDVNHGLNVDAGIFVSYIGLFSYYNFDNWTYQPSFVSSNTPWFFNGLRIQWFPTAKLKIEPWIINGWQSYARYNSKPGLGGQILWRPTPYLDFVWNNYGLGEDDAGEQQSGAATRSRIHADYSAQIKVYDQPKKLLDKIAFTVTADLGCEYGGGAPSGPYSTTGSSPEMGSSSTYTGGVNCHNSANGKREEVNALIKRIGILPSVRVTSQDLAQFAAETVYSAGIPVVEITMTTPGALQLISDLAHRFKDLAVGAGTVLDDDTARRCVDAGARFLTSPGFVPEVVSYAKKVDVVVFPGALTPTEVIAAWKAGADLVKIFPTGHVGGVQYLRALKVPLPQIPLIATGGVNQLTASDFILAGATAIGVGSELLPREALHLRQVDRIHELAGRFLAMVKEARSLREVYY